jgi:NAD(P)-dependent dehydrogenase (short-subunit alcohol dehydrogenase family)
MIHPGEKSMNSLQGQVALVTGASRGIGKGIAIALGQAGATVYVTGRTTVEGAGRMGLAGNVFGTAAAVTAAGGRGIAVVCDHSDDAQVDALFARIAAEQRGQLDILVNNVWRGYEDMVEQDDFTWVKPFWEQPLWRWQAMFDCGVRAHITASRLAARLMAPRFSGLMVNISFWAAQKHMGNVLYGMAKAADDKLTADMAHELRDYNVCAVSLYPGLVRTEAVLAAAEWFDMSNSESPEFQGMAIAALATDHQRMSRSGQVLVTAQLAIDYGFADIDGKQPIPATLATA